MSSRREDIRKLITKYKTRLQKLKELQAVEGRSVDPKILIEIEEIETEIEKLQAELKEIEGRQKQGTSSKATSTLGENIQVKTTRVTNLLSEFGSMFFYVSIPIALSLLIWMYIVDRFRLWTLDQRVFYIAYALAIPTMGFIFSIIISTVVDQYKRSQFAPKHKQAVVKRQKFFKILLSGIVIPILVTIALSLIPVSKQDTLFTLAVKAIKTRNEYMFVSDIGDAIISTENIDIKTTGITTLGIIQSDGTFQELLRIIETEPEMLDDWRYYARMVGALSSFGVQYKTQLLALFHKHERQAKSSGKEIQPDVHTRFFKQSFESLKAQVADTTIDQEKREELLLQLDEIEIGLKRDLKNIDEVEGEISTGGEPILLLVLDTFLSMENLNDDPEIYFLAKRVATDSTYTSQVRGRAIILAAQLGNYDDFSMLIPHLDSYDEILKKSALKGIAILHKKTKGLKGQEKETAEPTNQ